MIAFRPMQKNDVPRIAELERICFRSPWSESSLYGELRNSIAHYRVGEPRDSLRRHVGNVR